MVLPLGEGRGRDTYHLLSLRLGILRRRGRRRGRRGVRCLGSRRRCGHLLDNVRIRLRLLRRAHNDVFYREYGTEHDDGG